VLEHFSLSGRRPAAPWRAGALIAAALGLPSLANANVSCTGPVAYLGTDSNGVVYTATGTAINAVCSVVTQGSFQAPPAACKLYYSTLLASKLAGKNSTVFYNDPALTQCSQVASWSVQFSAYFITSEG
jgi:hypothetical protein